MWDKCDVLITANPRFFANKRDGKIIVKVNKEYNKECDANFSYDSLADIINDKEFVNKVENDA